MVSNDWVGRDVEQNRYGDTQCGGNGPVPAIRHFDTGATRDTNDGKYDYSSFNSPLVEKKFAAFMHSHRVQADGSLRSGRNWQKGIPIDVYRESLHRHFIDLELHLDGYPDEATDQDITAVLSAIRFNVNGMLLEILKERKRADGKGTL